MKKILLTFIGNNDCKIEEKPGAILSILSEMDFDILYIFYNDEKYLKPASKILDYCRKHYPDLKIFYQETFIENPTDYNTVYPAMYQSVQHVLKKNGLTNYTISLTSGTPTMHACWIFLQKGGIINAKLIQVQRETGISEINLELDDFPKIQHVEQIKAQLTKLSRENKILKEQKLAHDKIVGECPDILRVKEQIKIFSDSTISVFISGESGTGKELVAEGIHYNSSRKEKPFIIVNCSAISSELFESEFFGHKKGAFTGAITDKLGKFDLADEGTIFLDEIGDLPGFMQPKLLRVLQEGTFTPVGGDVEKNINVRIISATNRDIRELVREKKFRDDLFYRLVEMEINLPPLRNRGNDKIIIASYILKQLNQKYHQNKTLTKSALDTIIKNKWEGNIRQLQSAIEIAYTYPGDEIKSENMNIIEIGKISDNIFIPDEGLDLNNEILPKYYKAALQKTKGNKTEAAKLLRMEPHTFRARLRKLE